MRTKTNLNPRFDLSPSSFAENFKKQKDGKALPTRPGGTTTLTFDQEQQFKKVLTDLEDDGYTLTNPLIVCELFDFVLRVIPNLILDDKLKLLQRCGGEERSFLLFTDMK